MLGARTLPSRLVQLDERLDDRGDRSRFAVLAEPDPCGGKRGAQRRTLTFHPDPVAEFGEIIPDPALNVEVYYMQINSPRKYRHMLRSAGFGLRYFNSRSRIDAAKPRNWLADFDADFKCYVARKP